jgi:hypothetical protein
LRSKQIKWYLFETSLTTYKEIKNKLWWSIQNQQNIKVKLEAKTGQKSLNQKTKKLEDRIYLFF